MFLGVAGYVSIKPEEPLVQQTPAGPNEDFIPVGGGVYASNDKPCPSVNRTMLLAASSV